MRPGRSGLTSGFTEHTTRAANIVILIFVPRAITSVAYRTLAFESMASDTEPKQIYKYIMWNFTTTGYEDFYNPGSPKAWL